MILKNLLKSLASLQLGPFLGFSALETDHPLNVGMVGMHGNYGPNILTNECDLLIAIGMRFDDRVTGNLNYYAKTSQSDSFRNRSCRNK